MASMPLLSLTLTPTGKRPNAMVGFDEVLNLKITHTAFRPQTCQSANVSTASESAAFSLQCGYNFN